MLLQGQAFRIITKILNFKRKAAALEIAGMTPLYALYKDGELDFFVNSRRDYKNYAAFGNERTKETPYMAEAPVFLLLHIKQC